MVFVTYNFGLYMSPAWYFCCPHNLLIIFTMFNFKKLNVYIKAKSINGLIYEDLIKSRYTNKYYNSQLLRASISICANIAEGSAKFTNRDTRNFYIIARASAYECSAIIEMMHQTNQISNCDFNKIDTDLEEISRMLYSMIVKLQ